MAENRRVGGVIAVAEDHLAYWPLFTGAEEDAHFERRADSYPTIISGTQSSLFQAALKRLADESLMDPGYSDYDLSQDHPGYKLPVSNISYYVYPEESSHRDTEAVAQRAFKRIMDSYDEYEKLTEVFQVELDRRQQQAKERKEREKALREERQRQMKEEKKNRRLGKINHTGNNNNGAGKAPGIQPDTEQQLQVEILKNVNDYCSRSTPSKSPGIAKTITDTDDGVEPMVGIIPQTHEQSNGDSSGENLEHQQELQAKQDMEKVLESIESGRPGYPFFPTAYLHQALEKELQSRESAEPCTSATATERLPDQKHCRQSSNASSRSLELHDPTGNRLPEWTEHQTLELVGSRVLLDEVVAARAQLPLSWDNFSTRDCQVNKVKTIGKQDKDLELLEEVVQETIARQHAVQMLSEDSDSGLNPNHPQGNEKAPNHRASNHRREREGSSASTSSPPAPPTSKYAATRSSTKKALETPPPVATPSRRLGARTTRGVTRGSARGSDETDHVLKQRRVMRRSEKQRHDSSSRASSQAADGDQEDQGHHEDEMGAEDRIPEEERRQLQSLHCSWMAQVSLLEELQTMNQSDEAVKPHADLNAEVEVKVEAEAKSVDPDVAVESEGVNSSHQDKESVSAEHLQTANFDPHAMERELDSLASSRPSETTKANLPKSSKFLPGRVLRKGRIKDSDDPSENATSGEDLEMYDPDCTSCRLVLNAFDKVKWKQVQQAGDVQLNPKRWGKTAILCVACCSQFQKHHLRCTQCFYVPVIPEDVAGKTGAPKAGGTCVRCKAGTWLREN
ncbi:hypothetical protein BGX31_010554 [Mortierella sp. GBA43]|nr:hypothetical protein BGX31_010554 [Mortierella sp. GBA43]